MNVFAAIETFEAVPSELLKAFLNDSILSSIQFSVIRVPVQERNGKLQN